MMDGGIIPLKARGGGIPALEDIAEAGIGETPAAEPAATDDIHIFGSHSSARTFANLAERSGRSGLPASVTGDGTGFQVHHFVVIEAFADENVQDAYRPMNPDGFNVNRYSRRLPATIAALQALAAGNPPYTASRHVNADGTHFDMNEFQKEKIAKIVADFNAGRITAAEGRALATMERISPPKSRRDGHALRQTAGSAPHGGSASASKRWRRDASPSTDSSPGSRPVFPC